MLLRYMHLPSCGCGEQPQSEIKAPEYQERAYWLLIIRSEMEQAPILSSPPDVPNSECSPGEDAL